MKKQKNPKFRRRRRRRRSGGGGDVRGMRYVPDFDVGDPGGQSQYQLGSPSILYRGVLTVWGVRYRRYRTPHTVGRITATDDPQHESQEIISGRLKKRNFVNVVWRACFYPFSTDRKAPRTGQWSAKSEHFCLGKLTKKEENAHFGKKRPVLTSPHKIVRRPFWCWSGAPFAGGGEKETQEALHRGEARQGQARQGQARQGKVGRSVWTSFLRIVGPPPDARFRRAQSGSKSHYF